jgi:hypothetical protein
MKAQWLRLQRWACSEQWKAVPPGGPIPWTNEEDHLAATLGQVAGSPLAVTEKPRVRAEREDRPGEWVRLIDQSGAPVLCGVCGAPLQAMVIAIGERSARG